MSEINDISDQKESSKKVAAAPQIIKKIHKRDRQYHGGSWKIAFADFVTAMMAFFLLMWLIISLNKAQKTGIADYFKQPVKIALFGGQNFGNRSINTLGGGPDSEASMGQVKATVKPLEPSEEEELSEADAAKVEAQKLEDLKSEINLSINSDPGLEGLKQQLKMDSVEDGLRIQLIDNPKKPMFDIGSDKVNPGFETILSSIAKLVNTVPNKITIQGYTDAHPYYNPEELEYTNWELSSQRANAARRALIKAGMDENKVMSVTGFSSTVLLDKKNPLNPENRRISILVMKKKASDTINANK